MISRISAVLLSVTMIVSPLMTPTTAAQGVILPPPSNPYSAKLPQSGGLLHYRTTLPLSGRTALFTPSQAEEPQSSSLYPRAKSRRAYVSPIPCTPPGNK